MKPDPARLLDVCAAHLMLRTAPSLAAGSYEQSSVAGLARFPTIVAKVKKYTA